MKLLALACALSSAHGLAGQDATIRTTVPLVVLPTSVTDRRGHSIDGLTPSEFILLDNGAPKALHVDTIDSGLAPISLVVLIQTSDISLSALGKIRKVGAMIAEAVVGENGEVAVATFDDQIQVIQDFTRDANELSKAFGGLRAGDNMGGRMIDAVDQSMNMLTHRPGPRRSNVLIIGESRDRGSKAKLEDLTQRLQRSGVTIYALKYSAYLTPFTVKAEEYSPPAGGFVITELARLGKQNTMEALTRLTGGMAASFETKSKLEKDLMQVANDIHGRYLVSFVPDHAQTPSFHQLSIQVKGHADAVVRTRPGYWTGLR
jgi:VWFA-related protein